MPLPQRGCPRQSTSAGVHGHAPHNDSDHGIPTDRFVRISDKAAFDYATRQRLRKQLSTIPGEFSICVEQHPFADVLNHPTAGVATSRRMRGHFVVARSLA